MKSPVYIGDALTLVGCQERLLSGPKKLADHMHIAAGLRCLIGLERQRQEFTLRVDRESARPLIIDDPSPPLPNRGDVLLEIPA